MTDSILPKVNRPVYQFLKTALFIGFKLFYRLDIHGAENVPDIKNDPAGVILAPNHASYLDPPIFGAFLSRHVTYLAKDYLFKAFFVGWVLRSVGALPIKSESDDFRSIRTLVRLLAHGGCLVVFPEGTRSVDGQLKAPEPGIGFLACKSHSWVVPVYIDGAYAAYPRGQKWPRPGKIKVFFGQAYKVSEVVAHEAQPYEKAAHDIMDRIRSLKQEATSSTLGR